MPKVDLKKRVRERFEALPPKLRKAPVYLAVSAGMDSTVLAAVALELRDRLPPLRFLHVNYGLRRPDCDLEERMLRDWAAKETVPLHVLRLRPPAKPKNLQAWAREKRFAFFRKMIGQKSQGLGTVWLAHHQRDQAETVLLRLVRGAGLRGLSGMTALEELGDLRLFRPLLEVPQESLQVYARSHRLPFRQDRSNFSDAYLRNRIRRRILPLLKRENPSIEETLLSMAERAGQASEALESLARRWLQREGRGAKLRAKALRRQNLGLQALILERWLRGRNPREQSWNQILPRLLEALKDRRDLVIPLRGGQVKLAGENIEYLGP